MNKTTISTLIGAAVVTTLGTAAHAQENPFALKELASGYVQVAEAGTDGQEMKCGAGKCGGAKTNASGMNCGAMMQQAQPSAQDSKKAMEGKCAGMNMGGQAPAAPAAPVTTQPAK
jgi:uncharacterized low-complexity protein